jgi:hypothetical protein
VLRRYGFDSDDGGLLHEAITGLAAVAAAHGHDRTAATLSGAADAATMERAHPAIARDLEARFFAPARTRLGDQAWREAHAAGATLNRDEAIDTTAGAVSRKGERPAARPRRWSGTGLEARSVGARPLQVLFVRPLSTRSSVPVVLAERGEQSRTIASATSCGSASRPVVSAIISGASVVSTVS